MVDFKQDENQLLEYIERIGSNLPQMIVCSIHDAMFDFKVASELNQAMKKNKHIYMVAISNYFFKTNSLNLVLAGVQSIGMKYINLGRCKFENCFNFDTVKYLSNKQVNTIAMSKSTLSSSDIDIISKGISANKNLMSVSLDGCSINDIGLTLLSNAISQHKTLKVLDISSNKYTQAALNYFFDAMKKQKSISSLNLSYNEISNADEMLVFLQVNNSVAELNLSCCNISDTDEFFNIMKSQNSITTLNFQATI